MMTMLYCYLSYGSSYSESLDSYRSKSLILGRLWVLKHIVCGLTVIENIMQYIFIFAVDDDDVSDDVSDDRSMLPLVLRQAPLRSQISWLSRDRKGKALYPAAGKEKRAGLGRCIHNCMHSGGGLNFMQCKIMCLW